MSPPGILTFMAKTLTLTAVFTPDENGCTMAQLAEWPAVVTCGRTVEEARELLLDAARDARVLPRRGSRAADRLRPRRADHHRPRSLRRRQLEAHLRAHGCVVVRRGTNHASGTTRTMSFEPRCLVIRRSRPAPRRRSADNSASRDRPARDSRGTLASRSARRFKPPASRRWRARSACRSAPPLPDQHGLFVCPILTDPGGPSTLDLATGPDGPSPDRECPRRRRR